MPVAAVPDYLGRDREFYLSAPPGHRFLLYFPIWGENAEKDRVDWTMQDRVRRVKAGKRRHRGNEEPRPEWEDLPNARYACTIAACRQPGFDPERPRKRRPGPERGLAPWRPMMEAIVDRQAALAERLATESLLRLSACATAPFTTGLGNEHPLENGFAFLTPYGLPYLPGSSVKGVLRQAARELASGAWGEARGWSEMPAYLLFRNGEPVCDKHGRPVVLSMLDVLFGRETPEGESDHVRGALAFWDVIPAIAADSLMVDIMTPHYSQYYQPRDDHERRRAPSLSQTPHDSGLPNPIAFLTVPPGTTFTFHVVCDLGHLRRLTQYKTSDVACLPGRAEFGWKELVEAAFRHAFDWLGFGAKGATGYGRMVISGGDGRVRAAARSGSATAGLSRQAESISREIESLKAPEAKPRLAALVAAIEKCPGEERLQLAAKLRERLGQLGFRDKHVRELAGKHRILALGRETGK